jgi:murein DD-endopeptidase MepM/ murein hydrolase activator NlpD
MKRVLIACLASVFLAAACSTTRAPISIRGKTPPVPVIKPPNAIFQTSPVNAEQGPFQPDAHLYLCPNSTITNAFEYDATLRVLNFNPVVLVDGKVILTPVPTNNACVTSGFGHRMGRTHSGLDVRSRPAGMVYAAAPGRITEARYSTSFGNTVLIDHGQGVFTRYAHLANLESGVEKDRDIGFGQPLGIMGTTGNSTGVHLHFEVLTGDYVGPGRSPNLTARNPLLFPPYAGQDADS